jgi:hypothetical protein
MNRVIFVFWFFLVVAAGVLSSAGQAADDGDQVLSKSDAKCIADNIDSYLDDPADPVVVYLDLCASFDALKSISGNIRADLPDLPNRPSPPGRSATSQKPSSITLSKAVLRCLKTAAAAPGFPSSDPVKVSGKCQ